MNAPSSSVRDLVHQIVSLRAETDYEGTLTRVRADANLTGGNVWALAFAILIASVGLNVNSTAVIIGAMLISPLMGPIVGLGLALGTDDITLLRRSFRNLALATLVALVASSAYFAISPLTDAQSELLARTHPTLYDVLIALFGGSAGFVAVSRRSGQGNVVPGVAIATALMPPLCTAGFGLAHGDLWFFLGAMHLYLINALFICLAALAFTRITGFARAIADGVSPSRRIHSYVAVLTVILVLPSIYTAYHVVEETRFQHSARRFVAEQLRRGDRTVLNVDLRYGRDSSLISATLIGDALPSATLDSLQQRLATYGLARTRLQVRQPLERAGAVEAMRDQLTSALSRDFAARAQSAAANDAQTAQLEAELRAERARALPTREVYHELSSMEPSLVALGVGREASRADSADATRDRLVAVATWSDVPSAATQRRVERFLAARLQVDSIRVAHIRRR